jgi:hypothetical protein
VGGGGGGGSRGGGGKEISGAFSEKDIKEALNEMKSNSAHGPDGLFASFFKVFWDQVKEPAWKCLGNSIEGSLISPG